MKTRLNYYTATVEQIAAHFETVTRQAISAVRKHHKEDAAMTEKLNKALELTKLNRLKAKLLKLENK